MNRTWRIRALMSLLLLFHPLFLQLYHSSLFIQLITVFLSSLLFPFHQHEERYLSMSERW